MKVPIFEHVVFAPFERFGLTGSFWTIHLDTLYYTWAAMGLMFLCALIGRKALKNEKSLFAYGLEQLVEFFSSLCVESFGHFKYNYFVFVTSLFLFTLGCNLIGNIPFMEESTRDLNTTLAIALVSFIFIQWETIKNEGIKAYIKEFFQPIFLFFPLNLVEKLAKIVSMSFRLFGNILGGSIVFYLLVQALAQYRLQFIIGSVIILTGYWLLSLPYFKDRFHFVRKLFYAGWIALYALAGIKMFFGVFEGVIQAFVVAMLTITYLSVVISESHEGKETT